MLIVSKDLSVSSATVMFAQGNHFVEPLCYGVFTVCSAVTVECCVLYPCCVGMFGMFAVM